MKKIISISCLIIISIFLFTACSKDGIKDKNNGMVKITFNTPKSDEPLNGGPGGGGGISYTLSGSNFTYEITNTTGGIVNSGTASFGETKSIELSPANYDLEVNVKYNYSYSGGSSGSLTDYDYKSVLIEKGKVSTVSVFTY